MSNSTCRELGLNAAVGVFPKTYVARCQDNLKKSNEKGLKKKHWQRKLHALKLKIKHPTMRKIHKNVTQSL